MRPYCEQPSVEPRCAECLNLLLPDLGLVFSWGLADWGWGALGGRQRDWACARRDRSGGLSFRAVALLRNRVLRSSARCGPVPLTPVCGWGVVSFSWGGVDGELGVVEWWL